MGYKRYPSQGSYPRSFLHTTKMVVRDHKVAGIWREHRSRPSRRLRRISTRVTASQKSDKGTQFVFGGEKYTPTKHTLRKQSEPTDSKVRVSLLVTSPEGNITAIIRREPRATPMGAAFRTFGIYVMIFVVLGIIHATLPALFNSTRLCKPTVPNPTDHPKSSSDEHSKCELRQTLL